MEDKQFSQMKEIKSEVEILARAAVVNGADPMVVFTAMLAGIFEIGEATFQYDEKKFGPFLDHVFNHRKQNLQSPEFKKKRIELLRHLEKKNR